MNYQTKALLKITAFYSAIFYCLNFCNNSLNSSDSFTRALIGEPEKTVYEFVDPNMAYHILSQLDVFEPNYNGVSPASSERLYKRAYMGLAADDEYCDKHRAYFASNPNYVFTLKNFLTGYYPSDQIRNFTFNQNYNDSMPHAGYHRSREVISGFGMEINPNVSMIATFEPMFYHRHVGKQFSCLGQMSNHIAGHDDLYRKDAAAAALHVYSESYTDRPQCFDHSKFFPKNYLLFRKEQCLEFFDVFNSPSYQVEKAEKGTVFMRKIGADVHAGKGVFPVNEAEETYIRDIYKNGTACGRVQRNYIMQHFIHNPALVNGYKFDFRLFMLIASTNPLIAYYHDGWLRISGQEYDPFNGGKLSLLSNVKSGRMSFEEFQDYMLATGEISDPDWLNNYLRPEFKKAMIHLVRMSSGSFLKSSSLFELYGVDFIMDKDLNIWFIKANTQPSTNAESVEGFKLKQQVLKNEFDIVFAMIRSRMSRVFKYVNSMILNGEAEYLQDGDVFIPNLDDRIKEFKEVSKNRMDPEFDVGPENTFDKIVDESLSGEDMYMGLIKEECF